MPDLIEAGYVYLAKAPLYKIKTGQNERYIEKESELEEYLLKDKLERMEVTDRIGTQFKLTHTRWQRYVRLLKQYEGWASSLRAAHGYNTVSFLEESHVLDGGATDVSGVIELLKGEDPEGEPFTTDLFKVDDEEIVVKVVERSTGLASTQFMRRDMFESTDYRNFVRVHHELKSMAGTPPFSVTLGKKEGNEARSFEELRTVVLDVAKEGVNLSRFKGLGEMNSDQLFDTTMDPGRRTLQQVSVDDAAGADQVFSMLMGDKVEPRREFIEAHARDVTNLDV
jgi:DNA gyrase subunit B